MTAAAQPNCFLCGDLKPPFTGRLLCKRCEADPSPSADMTPDQVAGWNERLGRVRKLFEADLRCRCSAFNQSGQEPTIQLLWPRERKAHCTSCSNTFIWPSRKRSE